MIDLIKYQDVNEEVMVICTDGQIIIGKIDSVEDEEESGLGEMGLSMFTPDGSYLGIGRSEIREIKMVEDNGQGWLNYHPKLVHRSTQNST